MKLESGYFKSALFGLQDALISTAGVVVGTSVGSGNKSFVLLAALVTILVEALSMSVGEYTSEKSAQDFDGDIFKKTNPPTSALVMFISYIIGGIIPILPIFMLSTTSIFATSSFAIFGLIIVSLLRKKIIKNSKTRDSIIMVTMGVIAMFAGLVVGSFFKP